MSKVGQPRVPIIYGAAFIGKKPSTLEECQTILDEWYKRGESDERGCAIDTSNLYADGNSEKFLGKLDLHGARVDTKIYPFTPGDHSPEKIKATYAKSLDALGKGVRVRVLYLHAPDRTVPYAETLKAIDELHKEGKFEFFGLSNYRSYDVAEMVTLCRVNGWVEPSVYEGLYNAVDRTIETEMIPCLRRYNIKLAAYSPLAGGLLVGHLLPPSSSESQSATAAESCKEKTIMNAETSGHFDPKFAFGAIFVERYTPMVEAVCRVRDVAEKHGISLNEASIRWLQHHSALQPSDWGIIFGGSKPSHIEKTFEYNSAGPLPEEITDAFEQCYKTTKGGLPNYHHDPFWYDPAKHGF